MEHTAIEHTAYVQAVREQSEHFLEALAGVDPATPVPSCDGWTAADLLWHLGEVQHFWAQVTRGASPDEVTTEDRPADDALPDFVARAGTALVLALAERAPSDTAWSWHDDGGTVAWIARRQAHEALVHRVDAELTAGRDVSPPPVTLAVDGVDEMLRVMVDGVPGWGEFVPDGATVRIAAESGDTWVLALGRFLGTSPDSGTSYDLDAAAVLAEDDGGADTLVVSGSAWDLDLWLWGRGGTESLQVEGDPALTRRVRELFAEATQ